MLTYAHFGMCERERNCAGVYVSETWKAPDEFQQRRLGARSHARKLDLRTWRGLLVGRVDWFGGPERASPLVGARKYGTGG